MGSPRSSFPPRAAVWGPPGLAVGQREHSHGRRAGGLGVVGLVDLGGRRVGVAGGLRVGGAPVALRRGRGLIIEAVLEVLVGPTGDKRASSSQRGHPGGQGPQNGAVPAKGTPKGGCPSKGDPPRPTWRACWGCWGPRPRSGRACGCRRAAVSASRSAACGCLRGSRSGSVRLPCPPQDPLSPCPCPHFSPVTSRRSPRGPLRVPQGPISSWPIPSKTDQSLPVSSGSTPSLSPPSPCPLHVPNVPLHPRAFPPGDPSVPLIPVPPSSCVPSMSPKVPSHPGPPQGPLCVPRVPLIPVPSTPLCHSPSCRGVCEPYMGVREPEPYMGVWEPYMGVRPYADVIPPGRREPLRGHAGVRGQGPPKSPARV